jgi:hypothetical protein
MTSRLGECLVAYARYSDRIMQGRTGVHIHDWRTFSNLDRQIRACTMYSSQNGPQDRAASNDLASYSGSESRRSLARAARVCHNSVSEELMPRSPCSLRQPHKIESRVDVSDLATVWRVLATTMPASARLPVKLEPTQLCPLSSRGSSGQRPRVCRAAVLWQRYRAASVRKPKTTLHQSVSVGSQSVTRYSSSELSWLMSALSISKKSTLPFD